MWAEPHFALFTIKSYGCVDQITTLRSGHTVAQMCRFPPQICVFTAPLFSAFCALATFAFVKEVRSTGAGLLSASFVAIVQSYISRSVAGSYDNEGVAIFALVLVFYFYIKVG